jgi:hypothetical protein
MFKNYFKIAFRNLWRYRVFTDGLNIRSPLIRRYCVQDPMACTCTIYEHSHYYYSDINPVYSKNRK